MKNIIVAIISLLMGGGGAWIIQRFGYQFGIIDVPNERSSHTKVIPKGGGIGIMAAFILCGAFLGLNKSFWVPGVVLSIVSLFDDRIELSPQLRLIIQFFCSFIFLAGFFYYNHMQLAWLFIFPLAVFIVGSLNFYNFMDGINGIAGITGIVAFFLLALYGIITGGELVYIILCTAIAFSCAGFLPFNIPKAKVFMGDVGSILLGFNFACVVLIFSKSLLDFICLSGFLFPFYADELLTMAVRMKNGDYLGKPHRKHVYQLLANEYGVDHWKISLGYGTLQLVVGFFIIILKKSGYIPILTLLLFCFICFTLFSVFIRMKLGRTQHTDA